jgi:ribosome-binding factor A
MGRIRPERVAELIQREVVEILDRHLRDPRIHGVTVTDVEVSPDLKYATIFFSTLEGGETRAQVVKGLDRAAPAVRHILAPRLGLREVPEVRFRFDESLERGQRVEELLRKLRTGEQIEDEGVKDEAGEDEGVKDEAGEDEGGEEGE